VTSILRDQIRNELWRRKKSRIVRPVQIDLPQAIAADKHPRFVLHFIPTSSSWLNLVERWFAGLSQKAVRRGVFRIVADLEQAIQKFIDAWNANPTPFVWIATAKKILEKLARCPTRLEQIQPGCTKPKRGKQT
jgi:hypothetical protein